MLTDKWTPMNAAVMKFNQVYEETLAHSEENDENHMARVLQLYETIVGMMQKQIYQWPPLSAKYFSLVGPNLEPQNEDTIHDQFLHDRRRIPELLGRRIRGCFHGWVILSSHPESDRWTLWNPVTSKTIRLPRLVLKAENYKFIAQGCLSSSPDDPSSVLLLTRIDKPTILYCRLQGDNEIVVKSLMNDDLNINTMRNETHEGNIKSHLLNIPFDIMETIMEHCVGLEYLNFRATCKHCHLAAPMIQWSNETALKRLKTYSLVSPWLMVFDNRLGIITFTDPMFGDTYFIKTPQELIGDNMRIRCSKYGWILMFELGGPTFFYNPFTNDIRKLPFVPYFEDFGFSAPPTSPDCMVVACETPNVFIHFVNRESSWRGFHMDFGNIVSHSFAFPTCYGRDIYTLDEGRLYAFRNMDEGTCFWENVVAQPPKGCGCRSSAQHYLVKCDQQLLIVCVDEFGESVEVSKLNHSTKKWETVEHLGRHMIYICDYTCICMEAKTPEMENKIYFPRLHTKNGKIVFYSLETYMFHTFDGRNIAESFSDLFGTKFHSNPHTWIEPSWF
ncbi:hypothetical protein Tco_1146840 [Tanacetum coccineum]